MEQNYPSLDQNLPKQTELLCINSIMLGKIEKRHVLAEFNSILQFNTAETLRKGT